MVRTQNPAGIPRAAHPHVPCAAGTRSRTPNSLQPHRLKLWTTKVSRPGESGANSPGDPKGCTRQFTRAQPVPQVFLCVSAPWRENSSVTRPKTPLSPIPAIRSPVAAPNNRVSYGQLKSGGAVQTKTALLYPQPSAKIRRRTHKPLILNKTLRIDIGEITQGLTRLALECIACQPDPVGVCHLVTGWGRLLPYRTAHCARMFIPCCAVGHGSFTTVQKRYLTHTRTLTEPSRSTFATGSAAIL